MTLLNNWKFHLAAILYFLIVFFLILPLPKIIIPRASLVIGIPYLFFEWLFVAISNYLMFLSIVFFIERKPDFDYLDIRNIVKVIVLSVILQVLFQIILWPSLFFIQDFFGFKYTSRFTSRELIGVRILNFGTMFFISFGCIAMVYFHKIFLKNQNDLEQKLTLEKNLKEANLNTLKGQINPHFLFNSLNNIKGLVLENPGKSREMITRLSELLRTSLVSDSKDLVRLQQEKETVENYLEISKIQFENRLNYEIDIETEVMEMLVPTMMLQMLVENAVKHGIANLKDGGKILVKAKNENNKLIMTVTNTGQLSSNPNNTRIGLKNIEERLKLLYGDNANFTIFEKDNEVTAIIVIKNNEI